MRVYQYPNNNRPPAGQRDPLALGLQNLAIQNEQRRSQLKKALGEITTKSGGDYNVRPVDDYISTWREPIWRSIQKLLGVLTLVLVIGAPAYWVDYWILHREAPLRDLTPDEAAMGKTQVMVWLKGQPRSGITWVEVLLADILSRHCQYGYRHTSTSCSINQIPQFFKGHEDMVMEVNARPGQDTAQELLREHQVFAQALDDDQ
ncbi:hypothetical protein CYMTET_33946, partial [Cymbomonas tetramitiformis]